MAFAAAWVSPSMGAARARAASRDRRGRRIVAKPPMWSLWRWVITSTSSLPPVRLAITRPDRGSAAGSPSASVSSRSRSAGAARAGHPVAPAVGEAEQEAVAEADLVHPHRDPVGRDAHQSSPAWESATCISANRCPRGTESVKPSLPLVSRGPARPGRRCVPPAAPSRRAVWSGGLRAAELVEHEHAAAAHLQLGLGFTRAGIATPLAASSAAVARGIARSRRRPRDDQPVRPDAHRRTHRVDAEPVAAVDPEHRRVVPDETKHLVRIGAQQRIVHPLVDR